jgi:hypothetical protein
MISKEASSDTRSALALYFKSEGRKSTRDFKLIPEGPRGPLVSRSNVRDGHGGYVSTQDVYTRLAYNRPYVGRSVTDSLPTDNGLYKHQILVGRQMFQNDSCLIVHDPGTGKTITHVYVMLELLRARAITHVVIVNQSDIGNLVAMRTMHATYEKLYKEHFNLPFRVFARQFIRTITMSKVDTHNYPPYTGIVIDEAHNLLSDNEPGTKKVGKLTKFMEKISALDGIKLLLLSATPLFGDTSSLGKFRKILYRNEEEGGTHEIPSSLISYTQISYTHLKIVQRLNPDYDISHGDRSFKLSNGVLYPFKFYVSKPSLMQIADFAHLIITSESAPFQSKQKPLIVSSKLHTVTEKINGIDVEIEREESAIGAEIVKLIKQTIDGTIIIYCDLVEDGAFAIARYLDNHGFESYTKQDNMGTRAAKLRSNPRPRHTRRANEADSPQLIKAENDLMMLNRGLRKLQEDRTNTSEETYEILANQCDLYADPDKHLEAFDDVAASIVKYTEHYGERCLKNADIDAEIERYMHEISELEKEIEELKEHEGTSDTGAPRKQYYLLYLSTPTAEQTKAFKLFNSKDNWDGSSIKVIIGSRVMRDGVDIHHAVQTHIIIPDWRIPGYIQAQHRGIRSAGHKHLITQRAIRLVEEQRNNPDIPTEEKITYEQALAKITHEKVTVDIFNHSLSMRLITEEDVRNARKYFDDPGSVRLTEMSDLEVLNLFREVDKKNNAGEAIIEAAINAYKEVGSEMMNLRTRALDYKLNVQEEARVRDAITPSARAAQRERPTGFYAFKDTELFFMRDNTEGIIQHITDLLLKKGYEDTDQIFDELLNTRDGVGYTEQMIATAIVELTRNRGVIYHKYLGVNLYVKLWEKHVNGVQTESIIYLCTSQSTDDPASGSIHPYIAVVDRLGFCTTKYIDRTATQIRKEDVETLKKSKETFPQLRDLLVRIMDGARPTAIEIRFLIQLSNYWAFSWKDLSDYEQVPRHDNRAPDLSRFSVYVLEYHISDPDMNCLAKNLLVHEYQPSTRTWETTMTEGMKDIFLVRYGTFIWSYRRFNFSTEAVFESIFGDIITSDQTETNGIVLVKNYYEPLNPDEPITTVEKYVDNLFSRTINTLRNIEDKVVVKSFLDTKSRGKQVDKKLIKNFPGGMFGYLGRIFSNEISLPFFLYDHDTSTYDGEFNILDVKLREMRQMRLATEGNPPLRFKIFAVERMVTDPHQKRELYKRIYTIPTGLK